MSVGTYKLTIYAGVAFERVLEFLDDDDVVVDLTGYDAKLVVRAERDSSTALLTMTSTPAAGLTVDGPAGTVTMALSAAETTALTWTTGVYDLVLMPSGGDPEEPYLEGGVEVIQAVSR